jgi:hypothetical protein
MTLSVSCTDRIASSCWMIIDNWKGSARLGRRHKKITRFLRLIGVTPLIRTKYFTNTSENHYCLLQGTCYGEIAIDGSIVRLKASSKCLPFWKYLTLSPLSTSVLLWLYWSEVNPVTVPCVYRKVSPRQNLYRVSGWTPFAMHWVNTSEQA